MGRLCQQTRQVVIVFVSSSGFPDMDDLVPLQYRMVSNVYETSVGLCHFARRANVNVVRHGGKTTWRPDKKGSTRVNSHCLGRTPNRPEIHGGCLTVQDHFESFRLLDNIG